MNTSPRGIQTGSAIIPDDAHLPYPRFCAHRGFSTIAPENSMPAFGAAIALGAEEIEFDLWYTKDGEIVSCHDSKLDRVSTGTGFIYEHTYEELMQLDFGSKFSDKYEGLKIIKFEEILQKYACQVIMNVHIKDLGDETEYDEALLQKIVDLIDKYDARQHVYFLTGNDGVLKALARIAPDIALGCGEHMKTIHGEEPMWIVERAIELGCKKLQFFKSERLGKRFFNKEMVDKAHEHGIICNVFFADDPEEAMEYLDWGIDVILTNDYQKVSNYCRAKLAERAAK